MARYRKPRKITYTMENAVGLNGLTRLELEMTVRMALNEIAKHANVEFERVKKGQKGKITIRTYPRDFMKALGRKNYYPLGLQFRWGIALNTSRPLTKKQSYMLVLHELLHWMGLKHNTDTDSVMNINLTSTDLTDYDIKRLQRRWGKKYRQMYHTFPDGYKCLMREV